MDYESADRWNQQHPPGTIVSVRLVDGACFEAKTRSTARQWGNFAIVSLDGRPGMWTTTAMTALSREDPVSASLNDPTPVSARA